MLETLRIVAEEFQNQSVGGTKEGDMSWWARLCYAPAQIFAMEMYDMDMKGNTFESIVTTVVPRIFWPDKPIITQGHEFSYLVKGAEGGGGSGPGAFSEGYWNAGWAGFLFVTISLGLMHAVLTWFNLARFRQGDLRWLPVAFVSVKAAYRVDDWFVATVFGALPMMLASGVLVFSVAGLLHWGSGGRIAVGPGKRYGPTMRELRRH